MEVVDLVKPITKYAVLLKNKNDIKYELQKMLYFAKEGRPAQFSWICQMIYKDRNKSKKIKII